MNGNIDASADSDSPTERAAPLTRYGVLSLCILGLLMTIAGIQSLVFFSRFTPRLEQANNDLRNLETETTRGELFKEVENGLNALAASSGPESGVNKQLKTALQEFRSHFSQTPLDKIKALRARLPALQEGLDAVNGSVSKVGEDLDRLQAVYSDPYQQLYDDLDAPSWYLQPLASILADRSGYIDAVTYNRAMYLAQIGEIGTARVLLTGLYARAEDSRLLGLVYYGLGRLQYQQFAANPKPETYMQSVQYLRQSLQADPDLPLAKRLFDYLLSLSQKQGIPKQGKGEPTTFTEGNQGAISKEKPLF